MNSEGAVLASRPQCHRHAAERLTEANASPLEADVAVLIGFTHAIIGVVFRCTLSGSTADRWLEVPAWMFDRAACPHPPRLTASPFVSMDALSALSDLLRQALKPSLSSSNVPHSGASRSSHDQNRGEAH